MPLPCLLTTLAISALAADVQPKPWVEIRGIYGGLPEELLTNGQTLTEFGVNAVWMSSNAFNAERLAWLRNQGVRVFAEFNTLHSADYLKQHPEAAPVGPDGQPAEAPFGWQGVSPHHEGYRHSRMAAFRTFLETYAVDGIWLDYLHAHASWERADPVLPDTGFEPYALAEFQRATGIKLPEAPVAELSALLLGEHREAWSQWRCDVLTDWVREFRAIVDEIRPAALLGTFHCPWTDTERDGALRDKLHIDLRAQARYVDVFSPMPYHARFGHPTDPAWIARQTRWLGDYLGERGRAGQAPRIWPIVQLSDWGEDVPLEQVEPVLDYGTQQPSTGVMVFAWGGLRKQLEKAEAMCRYYQAITP